jgi:hypothetical protein
VYTPGDVLSVPALFLTRYRLQKTAASRLRRETHGFVVSADKYSTSEQPPQRAAPQPSGPSLSRTSSAPSAPFQAFPPPTSGDFLTWANGRIIRLATTGVLEHMKEWLELFKRATTRSTLRIVAVASSTGAQARMLLPDARMPLPSGHTDGSESSHAIASGDRLDVIAGDASASARATQGTIARDHRDWTLPAPVQTVSPLNVSIANGQATANGVTLSVRPENRRGGRPRGGQTAKRLRRG